MLLELWEENWQILDSHNIIFETYDHGVWFRIVLFVSQKADQFRTILKRKPICVSKFMDTAPTYF
jgi:hypothetical protein